MKQNLYRLQENFFSFNMNKPYNIKNQYIYKVCNLDFNICLYIYSVDIHIL